MGYDDFNSSYVHRPTFQDFLQDRERCTDESLFIDVPAHEQFMALRCMFVVKNLGSPQYVHRELKSMHSSIGLLTYDRQHIAILVRVGPRTNQLIGDERALVKSL